jgi:hypothetical protein
LIFKESEYSAEHVEEFSLAAINEWIKDINPKEHFICIVPDIAV